MKPYLAVALASALVVLAGCEALPCCQVASNGSQCLVADEGDLSGCGQQVNTVGPLTGGGCIGGTLDPTVGGPAGCTCVYIESTDPKEGIVVECFSTKHPTGATPEQCADEAAAACCAAGAGTNCS